MKRSRTGVTVSAAITHELESLPAADLLALLDEVWAAAQERGAQAPAMTHTRDEDDCPALVCPHCHESHAGVRDIDVSIRWTIADRMTENPGGGMALSANYGHADYDGRVLVCEGCEKAVTLPSDVTIVAV